MYDYTEEEQQIRKDSIQTEISKYINLEYDQEQEIDDEPLPELKNLMSLQSDIHCDGIPRVLSNCLFQFQQYDIPNPQIQQQEKTEFKREYSEKPECTDSMKLKYELRGKRKRAVICYNNDSDDDLQSNIEMNQPCKCSKSNCLKLYCSCFHRNIECTELCKCYDCHNTHDHSQIRNKALEKIKIKQQRQQHDDDLFDRTDIWGCKCKKSQCKKNYCECYIRNKKCSALCKCNGCENKRKTPKTQKKLIST